MRKHEREEARANQDPGEVNPPEPEIPVKRAVRPTQREMGEIQKKLAQNVRTVGQLMHGLLINLKVFKIQNPEARFQVPRTKVDVAIPAFDTHLPLTVISRSEKTAEVLVKYAGENETLLKWIVRFNGWFEGGEVGQLVGAHAVAAVQSAGVANPILDTVSGALIGDVLEQVQAENYQLRQQLEQMRQRMQVPAGVRPGDERGAGN